MLLSMKIGFIASKLNHVKATLNSARTCLCYAVYMQKRFVKYPISYFCIWRALYIYILEAGIQARVIKLNFLYFAVCLQTY